MSYPRKTVEEEDAQFIDWNPPDSIEEELYEFREKYGTDPLE